MSARVVEKKTKSTLGQAKTIIYPELKATGSKLGDWFFFWVVNAYKKRNKPWKTSDNIVWRGSCYILPEFIGIAIFFSIFWWIITILHKYHDNWYVLYFLLLAILYRLNVAIKLLSKISDKK